MLGLLHLRINLEVVLRIFTNLSNAITGGQTVVVVATANTMWCMPYACYYQEILC